MNQDRYIRQTRLSEIGELGQHKLKESHVIIIGCGGLGSIAAPYLAGAGVGKITLVDGDKVDVTNLHRQVFFQNDEPLSKSKALVNHLKSLNPEISISNIPEFLIKENINSIIQKCDLVLECTDDIMTKYLVNDYCHINSIPMVYGAIYKYEGYVSVFENRNQHSIHLRDVFPEPDVNVPTCSEVGVLNTIAGIIGLLQANEALKFILNIGESLNNKLLTYNALTNEQLTLKLKKSWIPDLQSHYENEPYRSIGCQAIPELTWEHVEQNLDSFELVSILEVHEHKAIVENVKHQPLSEFNINEWQDSNKHQVFYCMSGKRSGLLVNHLLEMHPNAMVFSLKGGLRAI